ncbi:MAG: RagB/SusD family nutrient uptake outer membrane protein [Marinifilaceae bacterium]|nr:RagB/SusD family nutrient uptake outer membrane protein [Marinifilaceae bacterium]
MRYVKSIICVLICLGLIVACSDFLEEKSQDEVIPANTTDYREILLNYQQTAFSEAILVMDDDVKINESRYWGDYPNSLAQTLASCFTWQSDMWEDLNTLESQYESMYTSIMAMNAILENIDDVEGDITEVEIVKAQALGTRAYYYFILVNMFGEPYNFNKEAAGVVLKLESPYRESGMERATVEKVYAQIVEDLEEASLLFNKYPKQRGDFLMNVTAADILLSRVYLYMEEWTKAEEAATRAIESAEGLMDYTTLPTGQNFYMTSYTNSEVEWMFCQLLLSNVLMPSNELVSKFDANDRRVEFLSRSSGSIKKVDIEEKGPNIMIRSAEAYLNRAEARVLSPKPDLTGALADLNELRRHRITGYLDVDIKDADILLNEIRDERRKELCFEGHRWFDLRRYGMPSFYHDFRVSLVEPLLRYTLQEKDPLYTLPIPRDVLENNVELEQNSSVLEPARNGFQIN